MNQLIAYGTPEAPYLLEQRANQRHEGVNLLVITERGTGQILDIHRKGLSFGCLYPHTFPNEFSIDILDANGSHIKRLRVRKMWETIGDNQEGSSMFELVVGLEFYQLTSIQTNELDHLLESNMESMDLPYSYVY